MKFPSTTSASSTVYLKAQSRAQLKPVTASQLEGLNSANAWVGWGMLAAVLDHMVDRLRAGARSDLLERAQVTYVKSRMARILWANGLRSVRALAEADAENLVPIMMQAQQSRILKLEGQTADKLKLKLFEKAELIIASAGRRRERPRLISIEE